MSVCMWPGRTRNFDITPVHMGRHVSIPTARLLLPIAAERCTRSATESFHDASLSKTQSPCLSRRAQQTCRRYTVLALHSHLLCDKAADPMSLSPADRKNSVRVEQLKIVAPHMTSFLDSLRSAVPLQQQLLVAAVRQRTSRWWTTSWLACLLPWAFPSTGRSRQPLRQATQVLPTLQHTVSKD